MTPEALIGKTPNLQAPSPAVVRLLTLLQDPNADYDEVMATVSRDVMLSAKLLALCNSAGYGLAQPVASLDQAALYLGFGEIHRLVMALSFGAQIGVALPGYDMDAGALWRHSLMTALLTPRVLALAKTTCADTSIAYTAGLVHDIGKLVIGQALDAGTRTKVHQVVQEGGCSLLQAEKTVIGCDHAEIGSCLLRKWRIPEIITEAVLHHHNPPMDHGICLSAAVHAADVMAHQTGASPGWESFAVVMQHSVMTALNLTETDLEVLTFAAVEAQDKVAEQEKIAGSGEAGSRTSAPAKRSF